MACTGRSCCACCMAAAIGSVDCWANFRCGMRGEGEAPGGLVERLVRDALPTAGAFAGGGAGDDAAVGVDEAAVEESVCAATKVSCGARTSWPVKLRRLSTMTPRLMWYSQVGGRRMRTPVVNVIGA